MSSRMMNKKTNHFPEVSFTYSENGIPEEKLNLLAGQSGKRRIGNREDWIGTIVLAIIFIPLIAFMFFTFDSTVFMVDVRHPDTQKWLHTIEADIGDTLEFNVRYANATYRTAEDVIVRDILPPNLEYIEDSTVLYNDSYPKGARLEDNTITTSGVNIGTYKPSEEAHIRFSVRVIGDSRMNGPNSLETRVIANVDEKEYTDSSSVRVNKDK